MIAVNSIVRTLFDIELVFVADEVVIRGSYICMYPSSSFLFLTNIFALASGAASFFSSSLAIAFSVVAPVLRAVFHHAFSS